MIPGEYRFKVGGPQADHRRTPRRLFSMERPPLVVGGGYNEFQLRDPINWLAGCPLLDRFLGDHLSGAA